MGVLRVLKSVGKEIALGVARGIVSFFSAVSEGFGRGVHVGADSERVFGNEGK